MNADVALAEARLKEAEQLRENMFIRAPFDGTVISKDAEVGESILPGGMGEASGRGSAVTIADLENLEVDCDVKEDYINRVQSDQQAEVAVDAVPGKRYRGLVRKVIPMGDRARATIKVKVKIIDVDPKLFPDMSCTVYFLPESKESDLADDASRTFCPSDAIASTDPTLIVADEPTGDLDAKSGSEILELMRRLNEEFEKTIIMVTHDPNAAARAKRIVYLEKGVLVSEVRSQNFSKGVSA